MKIPMLLPLIALVMGIIAFLYFDYPIWSGGTAIAVGGILYLILRSFRKNPILNFRYSHWNYGWIFLSFWGVGIITTDFSSSIPPTDNELRVASAAEGRVMEISSRTSGDRLVVDVYTLYDSLGNPLHIDPYRILLYSDAVLCSIDDVILFPVDRFTRIEDSGNSFRKDYASTMARKHIYHTIATAGSEIRIIGHSTTPQGISSAIRDEIVSFIEKTNLKSNTKGFIIPLLTGDKDYLDNSTRALFSEAGMAHILALSGLHIGIIAGIFLGLLFPLNFIGKYKLRYFLTALLLWGYAFVTGMGPSIIRACVMTTAFITAMLLERKNTALNSLCLAAFLILLITPEALIEPGFQLSFICVATLILFSRRLNPIDRRLHPKLHRFFGILSATLLATFSSWIITAYYFGSVPTMFLPSNLVVLPFLPAYIFAVLVFLILSALRLPVESIGRGIDSIYTGMCDFIALFGQGFNIPIHISGIAVALWLTGIIAWPVLNTRFKNYIPTFLSCVLLGLSLTFIHIEPAASEGIIICDTYRTVEMTVGNTALEQTAVAPLDALSLHTAFGKRILVADLPKLPNSLSSNLKAECVVVTGKYKGTIDELYKTFSPDLIVLHRSIRKQQEQKLISEADSLNVRVHSVRDSGAVLL